MEDGHLGPNGLNVLKPVENPFDHENEPVPIQSQKIMDVSALDQREKKNLVQKLSVQDKQHD